MPISIPAAEHTTEVSTSIIEPTTEVYTSTVERLSTTSALKVMTSIDNHKTIKTIENEKTSTVYPFVQSSEVASTVAKLKISTSTRSLIKDTMFTQSTSSISTSAVESNVRHLDEKFTLVKEYLHIQSIVVLVRQIRYNACAHAQQLVLSGTFLLIWICQLLN